MKRFCIGILILATLLRLLSWYLFEDMYAVKADEFLTRSVSPSGEYYLDAFYNPGNATSAMWVVVDARKEDSSFHRRVYSGTLPGHVNASVDALNLQWISDTEVVIGEHSIDILHEEYNEKMDDSETKKIIRSENILLLSLYGIIGAILLISNVRRRDSVN